MILDCLAAAILPTLAGRWFRALLGTAGLKRYLMSLAQCYHRYSRRRTGKLVCWGNYLLLAGALCGASALVGCQRGFSVTRVPQCNASDNPNGKGAAKPFEANYIFPPGGHYKKGKVYDIVLPLAASRPNQPFKTTSLLDVSIKEVYCEEGPSISADETSGALVLRVPAGGKFLTHSQTLRAVRRILHDAHYDKNYLEQVDYFLEKELPREVEEPRTDVIEIRPGYRLRVERAGLAMNPDYSGPDAGAFMGRTNISPQAGTGEAMYYVTRNERRNLLSFNELLSSLPGLPADSPQNNADGLRIVAISPDLQTKELAQRNWRIHYPETWGKVYGYVPSTVNNIVLIGSATKYEADIVDTGVNQNLLKACKDPAKKVLCACFAGRAMVNPEFRVMVQNQATWVPVGTTLHAVLEPYFNNAQATQAGLYKALKRRLRLRRLHGTTLADVSLKPLGAETLELLFQPGDELTW